LPGQGSPKEALRGTWTGQRHHQHHPRPLNSENQSQQQVNQIQQIEARGPENGPFACLDLGAIRA